MGAQSRLFTSLASGSGKATAVVVCAVMLLAGCGGSGGSATEASEPVIRGDVTTTSSLTVTGAPATAAVGTSIALTSAGGTGTDPVSYATTSTGCAITDSSLTATAAGTCAVTATKGPQTGTVTFTFTAATVSAPGRPPVPTVVVGDGKVTVTVAAGLKGGTPDYYTVQVHTDTPSYRNLGTCTVTGASGGSCDVTGLPSGYTWVRVGARNSAGWSPTSESGRLKVVEAGAQMWLEVNFTTGIGSQTGSMPTQIASTPKPLRANTWKPSGKDFVGWAIANPAASYASDDKVVWADKAIYSFDSDVWLAAVWRDQPVPGTPPAPTVVAGTAKVTATVAAGTSGGTPATYTVTAYAASGTAAGTCTVTGASGFCDVTALTAGSTYTVKASAKNTGGTSGESVASSPVIVATTVPGAPGLTSIARKTGTEVWVTFSAPSSDGGVPITEYTVTSKGPGGRNVTHSFPAQAGRVTFVGPLTQSGWYTFTVRAVNSVGTSTPSNATRYFKA